MNKLSTAPTTPTFTEMLDDLAQHCDACRTDYRPDGIRADHRVDFVESMLRVLLEKLRDKYEM